MTAYPPLLARIADQRLVQAHVLLISVFNYL
jgi:hypothetical protein